MAVTVQGTMHQGCYIFQPFNSVQCTTIALAALLYFARESPLLPGKLLITRMPSLRPGSASGSAFVFAMPALSRKASCRCLPLTWIACHTKVPLSMLILLQEPDMLVTGHTQLPETAGGLVHLSSASYLLNDCIFIALDSTCVYLIISRNVYIVYVFR